MVLTTYDPETGDIETVLTGSSRAELLALTAGRPFVEGSFAPAFFRIDPVSGQVVAKSETG